MRVTRDVISDLYVLYESGEASADTRALVESFLANDPELARSLQHDPTADLLRAPAPAPARGEELQTLQLTQTLLRRRSWMMGLAIFFTALPASSASLREGHIWMMWRDFPAGAIASLAVASLFWVGYFLTVRRLRVTGL